MLLGADVGEDHGGEEKHGRSARGQLAEQVARARGAEHRTSATAENDAHAFLAGLQQDQDDEGDTGNDVNGDHQCVQGNTSRYIMPERSG